MIEESERRQMLAESLANAGYNDECVVVEVRTGSVPKNENDRLLWSVHFANYITGFVDAGPKDAEILCRRRACDEPDTRAKKPIPIDDLKELINGLSQAANPHVQWQDNQIDMARDAIKIMRMDITTVLDTFIHRNNLQDLLDGQEF